MLILAAQRGSIAAFRRLMFDYDAGILAMAMRIAGSEQEAKRLYLETFLRIHEELPGFRFECAFHFWVARHFTAVLVEYLRPKRTVGTGGIDAAIDELTPRERLVIELKHYQRETLDTIGEILGVTKEAAGGALVRGMRRLCGSLDEHNSVGS